MKILALLRLLLAWLGLAAIPLAAIHLGTARNSQPQHSAQPAASHSAAPSGAPTGPASSSGQTMNMLVTLYGWDDNSPPGCDTAYSGCAGGAGTFSDPITFATDKSELPVGTVVYYPPLQRYFVMGDDCAACDQDWSGQGPDGGPNFRHIDLWSGGGSGDDHGALLSCEDNWTSDGQVPVIVNPPDNEPVANGGSGGSIFTASSSQCWQ